MSLSTLLILSSLSFFAAVIVDALADTVMLRARRRRDRPIMIVLVALMPFGRN